MKKLFVFIVLISLTGVGFGQSYYNEWIDYNKTYYKFKVGSTGLYRITANDLKLLGLSNEEAQNFQIWRNGKQVPLFTSPSKGLLDAAGYVEFWGERNDGVTDRDLYRNPANQLSDRESLLTDTAAFFLTVNTAGNNLRFTSADNNVSGNTLAAEPYFMYSLRQNFKDRIHRGQALVAGGEYVYSSTYDVGEMWSTVDIYPASPVTVNFSGLQVASSGPAAAFRIGMAGSAPNNRQYQVGLNNTLIVDTSLSLFNSGINYNPAVPVSLVSSNNASFKITNKSSNVNDRIVCGFFELNYPRLFDFSNQSTFAFTLAASGSSKYIEITNFNSGDSVPVLYDLANLRRYVADVSAGKLRFVLPPSSNAANLVLVSQSAGVTKPVTSFQQRTFLDYHASANQGDYLIITHPSLQTPYSGANQVEQYRAYRSSATGGGYNAKVYDIDQLVDQFGYGIKKNPMGIKNFLRYARNNFSAAPKYAFLIGKGLNYSDYRENENNPSADRLNLVPTFGYPASDILLASNNLDPVMSTLISRLSILYPRELAEYLDKVKQYEQAQQNTVQTIDNKAWMKNIVHVVGASDAGLDQELSSYMRSYQAIIEDTLFGGKVTNFNKSTTGPVTPIVSSLMSQLFQTGISIISYFGHSSASSLDYNLDDPAAYNNTGKYPFFIANGCNAGDFFSFDTTRFTLLPTLSEKYVLAKDKGTIGFIASTHFGITTYLDYYNRNLYKSIDLTGYGKSMAFNISEAVNAMNARYLPGNDLGGRLHAEETSLHGDPAIKINSFPQPDFVVEDPQVQIEPNIVSVADTKFTVKAHFFNIGKATGDSVTLQIKHRYPNGTDSLIFNKRIKSIRYTDSVSVEVPIVAIRDKGENKIIVSIDPDNHYSEISETNNTATNTFTIFEDELTPVYPYNFAIVNKANIKLEASTANPLVESREYLMELDTTENFNSSFKVSRNVASKGGLIEFDPGITFTDSTVYYWRVAPSTSGAIRWNTASFIYLNGSSTGFNQSHFYQHQKSTSTDIYIDSVSRRWKFSTKPNTLTIVNSVYNVSGFEDNQFSFAINGIVKAAAACIGHSVVFVVLDPITLQPLYNQPVPSVTPSEMSGGFLGSAANCGLLRQFSFEFSYLDTTGRRKMRDFLDWVPSGYYVAMRLNLDEPFDQTPLVDAWKKDATIYGQGNTLYDRLKSAGFSDLDAFTFPRTFAFAYRKNNASFTPVSLMSNGLERITLNTTINLPSTAGYISSPAFGPAKAWKQVKWRGFSIEAQPRDVYSVKVIGITSTGSEDTLYTLQPDQQDFSLSNVSAAQYPYIRLGMPNQDLDTSALTPYQLRYWRLLYDPVPEGALAPNIAYKIKDTLEVGEKLDFSVAFKNISDAAFADSLKVNMTVTDKNNVINIIPVSRRKNLQPGDTTNVTYSIDTKSLQGNNTLFVDVNPASAQPEQYHFNNFLYKNFFVKGDAYNPLMDVTFDGVHILNGDIVSSKPKIVIKLKDESKYLALDDTSLTTVFVQYPGNNGRLQRYAFGTDTLRFIPADLSTGKNEATIEFSPALLQDSEGDFYELIVKAKDKSGNAAGNIEYRVRFQVYNKPMISNMFNYPNPFTTSTAFVFTITGSDIPQNIRIQIMTITGKIVKEITKAELGSLHIGRNITDYKWDGTDQYGQKLANGIYLYRVITNLNGASLDKFNTVDSNGDQVDTDKYFNKGYGKMYLMR